MRVLESIARKERINHFQENIRNVLASSIAVKEKLQLMDSVEGAVPSLQKLESQWRELAYLDISPTGLFLSGIRSYSEVIQLWDAYATYSNVIDPSVCRPGQILPTKNISKVHSRLLEGYGEYFSHRISRNLRVSIIPSVDYGFDLRDVARIFNVTALLKESCDFFVAFPHAKVSDLYASLGLHPRTAERRFVTEGISAVSIKRACAISSASRYIFWSDLTLAEIARKFGYTDAAHLHHEFKRSTGGIPPSVYRRAARVQQ